MTFLSYFSQRNCLLKLWICDKCIVIVHIMKEFYLGTNCYLKSKFWALWVAPPFPIIPELKNPHSHVPRPPATRFRLQTFWAHIANWIALGSRTKSSGWHPPARICVRVFRCLWIAAAVHACLLWYSLCMGHYLRSNEAELNKFSVPSA